MLFHVGQQGGKPSCRHLDVGVEQQVVGGLYLLQSLVVAFGKTVVLRQGESHHIGELVGEHFQRAIGRPVVGHYYQSFGLRMPYDRRQEAAHHVASVPVQDDNGYFVGLDHDVE